MSILENFKDYLEVPEILVLVKVKWKNKAISDANILNNNIYLH